MFNWLNKIFNNSSPKIIRKGSCKRCGSCCRNITFWVGNTPLIEASEFEKLKISYPKLNQFYVSGKDKSGVILLTCKSLDEDNLCKSYRFRSLYCRIYPRISSKLFSQGFETLDECGYYYKSSIEFRDFLCKDSRNS
jgi:uncharacterized protein